MDKRIGLICISLASFFSIAFSTLRGESGRGENHWAFVFDYVFLRRGDGLHRVLVEDSNKPQCGCPDYDVLNARNVPKKFSYESGFRTALSYSPNPASTYEVSVLYVPEWTAEKTVHGTASLSFPFASSTYTNDYVNADKAEAKYTSHYLSSELNYWYNFTPRWVNYFAVSGIFGIRYMNLREGFTMSFTQNTDTSSYRVQTNNHLYGLQIGANMDWNPTIHWTWNVMGKIGLMANEAKQKSALGDNNNTTVLRHLEESKWGTAFFMEGSTAIAWRPFSWWDIHLGIMGLRIRGVALGPGQLSDGVQPSSGDKVHNRENATIYGPFAGMTFSF